MLLVQILLISYALMMAALMLLCAPYNITDN